MYHRALEQLRITLDETQLGLQMDQYSFDKKESKMSKKESALFTKIGMKWNAMELGMKEDEFVSGSSGTVDSRSLERIKFVMDLFEDYFLKEFVTEGDEAKMDDTANYIEIVMKCLSNYNSIALLNDFHHIRGHKKEIKDFIGASFGDKSAGQNIGEMMRKYRERDGGNDVINKEDGISHKFKQFMDGLDLRESHLLGTSVKIHTFVCHEVYDECGGDEEDATNAVPQKQQRPKGHVDALKFKFMNELHGDTKAKQGEAKRMDALQESLRENGLSDVHCSQFERILIVEQYDSETIIHDLVDEDDRFNLYPDSNLFPILQNNLYLAKITKKHFGNPHNDDDELPPFTFGMEILYHTEYFQDRPGYVGPSKYQSLKEECLNNKIHQMSQEQFAMTLHAAYVLMHTNKGRTMRTMDRGWYNTKYEVAPDFPLSVSHLFVLLMYCNFTTLQHKYKKFGCRERDSTQTLEELKEWNREIAHWHRLIYEVVTFFGEIVNPKHVFYTGLNVKLSFETFAPLFNAPFSTTIDFNVANGFCGDDHDGGVILQLRPADGSMDTFFDVEWLSDFAHEKERLFVFMKRIKIADIHYYEGQTLRNNTRYLRAFDLFSSLFSGHFIINILQKKIKKNRNKPWMVLLDLITIYNANNNIPSAQRDSIGLGICIPIYVQQLFYHLLDGFRRNKKTKYIIKSQFDLLNDSLKSELISVSDEDDDCRELKTWTPFMHSICSPQQITLREEYIWVIEGKQLKELQRAERRGLIESDPFYLMVSGYGRVSIKCQLHRRGSENNRAGFWLRWGRTTVPLDGIWSLAVNEMGYYINNCHIWDKKDGWDSVYIFDDDLIQTVDFMTIHVAICMKRSATA